MELYLYGPIFSFRAEEEILPGLESANQAGDEEVTMRINSPGGSVASGWGIAAKMGEISKQVNVKIDGVAASMGTVIALFGNNIQALDVSEIMIHRAAGPEETQEERDLLARVNKNLKDKLKARVDADKLKEIAGVTIDQLFDTNRERMNVWLTAQQAKQVGIVDSIRKIDSKEAESEFKGTNIAALNNTEGRTIVAKQTGDPNNEPQNQNVMTFEELKAQYPGIFNQAKEEGRKEGYDQGVTAERERVKSFLTYVDADQKDVVERINNGEDLKPSVREDYNRKLQTKAIKGQLENESPENTNTPSGEEGNETEENKEIKSIWDEAVKPELSDQNQ